MGKISEFDFQKIANLIDQVGFRHLIDALSYVGRSVTDISRVASLEAATKLTHVQGSKVIELLELIAAGELKKVPPTEKLRKLGPLKKSPIQYRPTKKGKRKRKRPKTKKTRPKVKMASKKQLAFIKSLRAQTGEKVPIHGLTMKQARATIQVLLRRKQCGS